MVQKKIAKIGLDFGTSNSAVSYLGEKNEILFPDLDVVDKIPVKTIKSVIYLHPENKNFLVGQEAVEAYIENDCAGRFLQSVKTLLPSEIFSKTLMNNNNYYVDDIVAIILKEIKSRTEKKLGQEIDTVTIGRPVKFSQKPEIDKMAEDRLLSAAKKSGFKEISFQFEPVAAALSFLRQINETEKKERLILVADYGGGTSDFVLMKTNGISHKIIGMSGIYVGGEKLNSLIMRHRISKYFGKGTKHKTMSGIIHEMPSKYMTQLEKWHLIAFFKNRHDIEELNQIKRHSTSPHLISNLIQLIEDNLGYLVFQSIEKAKCELTTSDFCKLYFESLSMKINEKITRKEFETIIGEDVSDITKTIKSIFKESATKEENVDFVFTTGGTSLVPAIRSELAHIFGADKVVAKEAFTSVAAGLCL